LKLDCYTDKSGFHKLKEGWAELLENNNGASIFQTLEWNLSWWDSFGDGRELLILAFYDGEGMLSGIAPLYSNQPRDGRRILKLVGGIDLSDYLDLICKLGSEESVCMALMNYLREDYHGWESLELHNIPSGSPTLKFMPKAARELGLEAIVEKEEVCPYIDLPSTWDEYLSTLSRKNRHELRRKMRKASSAGGDKRHIIAWHDNLDEEFEDFFRLHSISRKEKEEFMEDGRRKFFFDFASRFHDNGWLELSFLMIQGKRAASLLSFKYRDGIYLYNSGFDPSLSAYSAGIAIIGHSIRDSIEEGYRKYDLLRGGEDYKYRLGARDSHVYSIIISP